MADSLRFPEYKKRSQKSEIRKKMDSHYLYSLSKIGNLTLFLHSGFLIRNFTDTGV